MFGTGIVLWFGQFLEYLYLFNLTQDSLALIDRFLDNQMQAN